MTDRGMRLSNCNKPIWGDSVQISDLQLDFKIFTSSLDQDFHSLSDTEVQYIVKPDGLRQDFAVHFHKHVSLFNLLICWTFWQNDNGDQHDGLFWEPLSYRSLMCCRKAQTSTFTKGLSKLLTLEDVDPGVESNPLLYHHLSLQLVER